MALSCHDNFFCFVFLLITIYINTSMAIFISKNFLDVDNHEWELTRPQNHLISKKFSLEPSEGVTSEIYALSS